MGGSLKRSLGMDRLDARCPEKTEKRENEIWKIKVMSRMFFSTISAERTNLQKWECAWSGPYPGDSLGMLRLLPATAF